MINIAIMTWFFGGGNYGQTLQAYALGCATNAMGWSDVFYQNIDSEYADYSRATGQEALKMSPRHIFNDEQQSALHMCRLRSFDAFIRRHFNLLDGYSKKEMEISMIKNDCRVILCGGDQIWNPYYFEEGGDIYISKFDDFINYCSLSYGSSIGANEITSKKKELFEEFTICINKLNSVSIREQSGKELLENEWKKNKLPIKCINVVLDPAFLLSSDEWISLTEEDHKYIEFNKSYKNYILCYIVGQSRLHLNTIGQIAQEMGKQIHYIVMDEELGEINNFDFLKGLDPLEFVWEVAHADYVIGDSYHAAVFSIIFNKEFALFKRDDREEWNYKHDGRMEQLCRTFEIENRYIESIDDYHSLSQIDYNSVNNILNVERENSLRYLRQSLYDAYVNVFVKRYVENGDYYFLFPKDKFNTYKKIIIYGAGAVGYHYFCQGNLCESVSIVMWVDKEKTRYEEIPIDSADRNYDDVDFDYILIANNDEVQRNEIKRFLLCKKIPECKIICKAPIKNKDKRYETKN